MFAEATTFKQNLCDWGPKLTCSILPTAGIRMIPTFQQSHRGLFAINVNTHTQVVCMYRYMDYSCARNYSTKYLAFRENRALETFRDYR
jgi:hypothetical protein